jgi:Acetyltransferase (GNAT) domain
MDILLASDPLDTKRWTALVENSTFSDVYYLPEYACASAEIERTVPVALIAGASSCKMLAPLLIRRMSANGDSSAIEWLDAATPYGYGGVLSLSPSGLADTSAVQLFFEQLHEWCSNRKIVCCVIRLHPMLEQHDWMHTANNWQDCLRIHSRGITTAIDLSRWNEKLDQPAMLRKDRCSNMRLASRTLRVSWNTGEDDLAERNLGIFSSLYCELMDRNGAESFYRFPNSYFTGLKSLGTRLGITLAWYEDKPVGGSLFLFGPHYTHYHLSAVNDVGRKHGASTLLVIEGARRAREHGCDLLHLGGGTKPGDSLEDFKCSFGGRSHVYRYITFIADPGRFNEIRNLPGTFWPYKLLDSVRQSGARPIP